MLCAGAAATPPTLPHVRIRMAYHHCCVAVVICSHCARFTPALRSRYACVTLARCARALRVLRTRYTRLRAPCNKAAHAVYCLVRFRIELHARLLAVQSLSANLTSQGGIVSSSCALEVLSNHAIHVGAVDALHSMSEQLRDVVVPVVCHATDLPERAAPCRHSRSPDALVDLITTARGAGAWAAPADLRRSIVTVSRKIVRRAQRPALTHGCSGRS